MNSSKQRLGRGLGGLIAKGGKSASEASHHKHSGGKSVESAAPKAKAHHSIADAYLKDFQSVLIDKIDPNPYQPRKEILAESLQELIESIRSEGLIQPIIVRVKAGRYELIAGERRLRACQQLLLKTIPARILDVTDSASAILALVENLQRSDLNSIEEALGYASLMRDFGLTQEAVAERLGKARASIANSLRLLQLDREIQGYLSKGQLSTGHAKVILGIEGDQQRLLLARRILQSNLTVRETEKVLKAMKGNVGILSSPTLKVSKDKTVSTVLLRDLEKRLKLHVQSPVHLYHGPKKGKLVIEYQGDQELHRILERLGLKHA
jgi:ParB family chromosome partitioning protein